MALGKYSIICLVALLFVSSLLAANSSGALNVAKPSVPVFSLDLENGLIEITIQNQKLILTTDNESLYYNVRVKDHLDDQWTELYTLYSTTMSLEKGTIPIQSDAEYTILPCPFLPYPLNTTVDFQVQALYGHYYMQEPASHSPSVPDITAFNIISESGWSNPQSVYIGGASNYAAPTPIHTVSPTNNPAATATPSHYESNPPVNNNSNLFPADSPLTYAVIAIAALAIALVGLMLYVARLKRRLPPSSIA